MTLVKWRPLLQSESVLPNLFASAGTGINHFFLELVGIAYPILFSPFFFFFNYQRKGLPPKLQKINEFLSCPIKNSLRSHEYKQLLLKDVHGRERGLRNTAGAGSAGAPGQGQSRGDDACHCRRASPVTTCSELSTDGRV